MESSAYPYLPPVYQGPDGQRLAAPMGTPPHKEGGILFRSASTSLAGEGMAIRLPDVSPLRSSAVVDGVLHDDGTRRPVGHSHADGAQDRAVPLRSGAHYNEGSSLVQGAQDASGALHADAEGPVGADGAHASVAHNHAELAHDINGAHRHAEHIIHEHDVPLPRGSYLFGLPSAVVYVIGWIVVGAVRAILYILRAIITTVKYPAAIILIVYVTILLLHQTAIVPRAAEVISTSLCTVPGMPVCPPTSTDVTSPLDDDIAAEIVSDVSTVRIRRPQTVDFPSLMAIQSRTFDALLGHSAAGCQLALGVKHAELALQDLVYTIRTSTLVGKTVLAGALEEFAQEAKATTRQLQHMSSKLDSAIDTILAFDDFALRVLAETRQPGTVNRQDVLSEVFQSALDVLASQASDVQGDAAVVVTALDALESRLAAMQALFEHESLSTGAAVRDGPSFWSAFTGDTPERQELASRLEALTNFDSYRRRSVAYITATTQTLVMIEADVSELQKKLAARYSPSIGELPIDVHIASIERSARRLHDGRLHRQGGICGFAVGGSEVSEI